MLISRGYVTGRAGTARALAAVVAAALLAGCGGGGSGTTTPSTGASASPTPVVSGSGAGVVPTEGPSGSAAAGSVSHSATGSFSSGTAGTVSHASVSTFSVSHSPAQVSSGSGGSKLLTPTQVQQAQQQASQPAKPATHPTTTTPAATTHTTPKSTPPPPTRVKTVTKKKVVVVNRYKVYTVFRTRTITKVVTKVVAPQVPAGAFLPSKHPQLGQQSFTITGSNVSCVIGSSGVRCAIKVRSWTAPAAPASCRSTWGSVIALASRGLPKFACGGSNPLDSPSKVIPSGWDDKVGNYTCQVRSFGINCFDSQSRSGFMIGRTGYTLY